MELNLSSASEGAMADLNAANMATPDPTPEPSQAPPAEPTPEATAEQTVTPPPEPEEEIKWNGQTVRLPKSQALELAQKGYDYTQKTMILAEERRRAESEISAARQQLEQQAAALEDVFRDPAKLAELQRWYAQQQGLPTDQADIPTVQQTQQLINQQISQVQQQLGRDITRARFEMETGRLEQEYTAKINSHMDAIVKSNPILQDVEGIDRLLRDEVAAAVAARVQAKPNEVIPIEDTLQLFNKAAERRAAKLEGRIQDRIKAQAAKKADVINSGIEPPGGGTPPPPVGKTPKLGSKELHDLVLRDLMAATRDA